MRGQHHGQVAHGHRVGQHAEEVPPGQRVERRDRLVEQQQPGLLGQDQGQRHLNPLAAGQLAHRPVQRNLQPGQPLAHQRAVPARVQVRAGLDVVLGGQPPVQRDLLAQVADVGQERRILARGATVHRGPARGRPGQPGEQTQQRGLARSVRPDERGDPALGDGDRAVVQGGDLAVALGQTAGLDRESHAISSSSAARKVTRSSSSIVSSSSPASRASLTHRPRLRLSRETVPGGGPGGRAPHERAVPDPGLDQALALQVAIGLQHGVGVDRRRRDDLPHGGQLVAHLEQARPQRLPDLLDDLQVGRHHRTAVNPETDHAVLILWDSFAALQCLS